MLETICALPFYIIWLILGGGVIRAGWLAVRWRTIRYRWPTPMGRMTATLSGDAVALIGGAQMIGGALLLAALAAALVNAPQLNQLFGTAFCLTLPLYALLVRLLIRQLDVTTRHSWR